MHEATPPLAWDHEQMPFQLPPEAIAWKVRHYTGKPGRPPAVYGEHGIVHLSLDSTVEDLRRSVGNKPGSYRLYPVDSQGRELSPVACMEITALEEPAPMVPVERNDDSFALREVVELCKQMVASRDAHDALLASALTTLVSTTATIQRSTATVLGAANTTIQVANGVESLERLEAPKELDVDELAETLAEALESDEPEKEEKPKHWVVELANSQAAKTLGMGAGMFLKNFADSVVAAQRAAAQAAQPPAPPPMPAPEPRRNAPSALDGLDEALRTYGTMVVELRKNPDGTNHFVARPYVQNENRRPERVDRESPEPDDAELAEVERRLQLSLGLSESDDIDVGDEHQGDNHQGDADPPESS